jgi:hypothetical protein
VEFIGAADAVKNIWIASAVAENGVLPTERCSAEMGFRRDGPVGPRPSRDMYRTTTFVG